MEVLDLVYINENTKVEQLIEYSIGTVDQQEEVTRAWNYVENKIWLDIDKTIFEGTYPDEFKFLVLNLLECFWLTKDILLDMATKKGWTTKVDDVSETTTRKDTKDMFTYRGIPCDEDTIASLMWYSQDFWVGNMTIDLSDVI